MPIDRNMKVSLVPTDPQYVAEMPYYAVIFTSLKKIDSDDYSKMADQMEKLSSEQDGFLGIQSVRGTDGRGITVSYWKSLDAIAKWKANAKHRDAQEQGKRNWYSSYEVRVCRVERQYKLSASEDDGHF